MTDPNKTPGDDASAKARAFLEQQKREQTARANGEKPPVAPPANTNGVAEDIAAVARAAKDGTLKEVADGYKEIKKTTSFLGKYIMPVVRAGWKVMKGAWNIGSFLTKWTHKPIGWLWDKGNPKNYKSRYNPETHSEGKKKFFSAVAVTQKSLAVGLRTWMAAWAVAILVPVVNMIPVLGSFTKSAGGEFLETVEDVASYTTTQPAYDLGRIAFMGGIKKEIVYLNPATISSADIKADDLSLHGTRKAGGATTDDAVFFKVESRLVNQVWNLWNKHWFFVARDKTGVVTATDKQAYEVTYFGSNYRINKLLQAYPQLLDVRRLSDEEAAAHALKTQFSKAGENAPKETATPAAAPAKVIVPKAGAIK